MTEFVQHMLSVATRWAAIVDWLCLAGVLLVLLPAALFRRTRRFATYGLLATSFPFGISLWIVGAGITLDYWGWAGIIVGLFLVGVGVAITGFAPAILRGEWSVAVVMTVLFLLTAGARLLAIWIDERK